ncbi:MAG TPA: S41 family peptidase [Solirubrobacteraceae bacterium]|nr:S41 family peptidase [Solirubrobacteraceae bacterium]
MTALDLDELTRRQDVQIDELRNRLQDLAVITRLSEISDGGALSLGSADPGASGRKPLSLDEMRQIVDRAILLLSSFYVHLPSKRALYASDPLQALRNLRTLLGTNPQAIHEEEFHDRMTAIFVGLRDRHTNYYLPSPYRHTLVFLPFLVEATWDSRTGRRRYLVTKLAWSPREDDAFRAAQEGEPPVEVTHVNGMPIAQVVARNGEESAGSNREARHARGVDRLTFRWLGLGTGPREDWVDVRFTVGDQTHERRFEWLAARQFQKQLPTGGSGAGIGHDLEGEWIREVKEALYVPKPEPKAKGAPSPGAGIFAYRTHREPDGGPEYGYLRIYSFEVPRAGVAAFLRRIAAILRDAPEDGLIIDIRGNPGGNVIAAEGLLQLFSATPVARQGIQFLNTPDASKLADAVFKALMDSPVSDAQSTAAPFVLLPRMPQPGTDRGEQVYQGPVVLIVDANCYSASEMFAAGMQDNGLARVIGTHKQTGGGGGILWSDEAIARVCGDRDLRRRLAPLPGDASFEVAVLRTTRAGERAGAAVEDMGVVATEFYKLSAHDVLGGNAGLLTFATEALADIKPRPLVQATYHRGTFTLRAQDLDRVDVYVDDEPFHSFTELDGECRLVSPVRPPNARVVFRGVHEGKLVTTLRWGRGRRRASAPSQPSAAPPAVQDREV